MTLIIFLVVLSLLVLFHECGHFFAAKFFGCRVDEFGFGFPPRAASVKKWGTLWSLNWIPLGGFVKIKGETGDGAHDSDSFAAKPLWQKAIILVAGVFMNLVLAFLLFWIGYVAGFPSAVEQVPAGAVVRDRALTIERVLEDSPAAKAGIREGEKILEVNGRPVGRYEEFTSLIPQGRATEISLTVGNHEIKTVTMETVRLPDSEKFGIGVGVIETGTITYPFFRAALEAARTTWAVTAGTFLAFGDLLGRIVTGKGVGSDVSGPVGIAVLTGQVARLGIIHLIQFAALLSVNLAILNIIPFPALDGGRLLFVVIAKLRGHAVASKVENAFHAIGFFLLMLLVIVVTYRDVAKYGASILGSLANIVGR